MQASPPSNGLEETSKPADAAEFKEACQPAVAEDSKADMSEAAALPADLPNAGAPRRAWLVCPEQLGYGLKTEGSVRRTIPTLYPSADGGSFIVTTCVCMYVCVCTCVYGCVRSTALRLSMTCRIVDNGQVRGVLPECCKFCSRLTRNKEYQQKWHSNGLWRHVSTW